MGVLDSNLLIYSAQDEFVFLRSLIGDNQTYLSVASKLETLGHQKLSADEQLYFDGIFRAANVSSTTDDIVDRATELRRQKKMSIGGCIIAATALLDGFVLYTNNTKDFIHISGPTVVNPLNEQ